MNESVGQGERDAASRGIVIGPGEGRTIPGTDAITLIATGEQTGGSIGVFEDTTSPGDGPPPPCSLRLRRAVLRPGGRVPFAGRGAARKRVDWNVRLRPSGNGSHLQGHRDRVGKVAFGFHPRGAGAGLRGVRQVTYRGRRGESECAPKQERGADE